MTVALKRKAEELAAKLTPNQRVDLADLLYASLPQAYQKEIDRAWDREIDHRLDEYEAGEVKAISSKKVHASVRRRLNEIKAGRISSRRAA